MSVKALNQNLYSNILYGSELAGDSLTLQSTSNPTLGPVQIVSTSLDLVISGVLGRFVHNNTAGRTYTFPDADATLLGSNLFSAPNQLLYSLTSSTYGALTAIASSVLTTNPSGTIGWTAGADGTFLQLMNGTPTFAALPNNVGTIANGAANELSIYSGTGNALSALTTVANSVLASPNGVPTWGYVNAGLLLGASGALGTGSAGNRLESNGDGAFRWIADNSYVNAGTSFRLSYYTTDASGQQLASSNFVQVNETSNLLYLFNSGAIQFYESTLNGSSYVQLNSPQNLSSSVKFTLPAADGSPGAYLTTDGNGNLSFASITFGTVNSALANQLTYYATTGNSVKGLTTTANRVLVSPAGVPTWAVLTANYLAQSGGIPLGNGSLNNTLVSNSDGTFNWIDITTITGKTAAGSALAAAMYAVGGTTVSGSALVTIDDTDGYLAVQNGGELRLYNSGSTNYVALQTGTLTENLDFILPDNYGSSGQVLTTDGIGNLGFTSLPPNPVDSSAIGNLAYYVDTDTLGGLTTNPSSVLLSDASNSLIWGLITSDYFQTSGGTALTGGSSGQVLSSDGNRNFVWLDPASSFGQINAGFPNFIPYYDPANSKSISSTTFLSVDNTDLILNVLNGGAVAFSDSSGDGYSLKFAAPALFQSISWLLPSSDAGSPNEALVSDGAGNLSFQLLVAPGITGALGYYQGTANRLTPTDITYSSNGLSFASGGVNLVKGSLTSSASDLLLESVSGLSPANIQITAGTGAAAGGNITLTTGGGVAAGSIYFNLDSQTVAEITAGSPNRFALVSGTSLAFLDGSDNAVGFSAPAAVSTPVIWTLPASDGSVDQGLYTDGNGTLAFEYADVARTRQQRGYVSVPAGVNALNIVFEQAFNTAPDVVLLNWSIETATSPSQLPGIAMRQKTPEGVYLEFSDTTTQTYTIYYEAYVSGFSVPNLYGYLAGGYLGFGGGSQSDSNLIFKQHLDTNTIVGTSNLPSATGFTTATASTTYGFILGGETANLSNASISCLNFSNDVVTSSATILQTARDSAAGVTNKTYGYLVGGNTQTGGGTTVLHSIEQIQHSTVTSTTVAATTTAWPAVAGSEINGDAIAAGACNATSYGYITHSVDGNFDKISFSSETVVAGTTPFTTATQVGCNYTAGNAGFFGASGGNVYEIDFNTDSSQTLAATLTSTNLSCAYNSLVSGYFAGTNNIDMLSFLTDTVTTIGTVPVSTPYPDSISTFQTQGIL